MDELTRVHYLFESTGEHVPWEEAGLLSSADICELGRKLNGHGDVIYLYPKWCRDRIVLWGIDGTNLTVEFQKATEAMNYCRKESVDRLPEILENLRGMFSSPLEHGFEQEQF